ncbi:MAG: hypothetical protein JSR58_03430 [Verrucomicrobia bacterium]|nr:hypothetical protein [Verrucomicrobiota bacterium]
MSITDKISQSNSEVPIYNSYIARLRQLNIFDPESEAKCKGLFHAFSEEIKSLSGESPPEPSVYYIERVIENLESNLIKKTCALFSEIGECGKNEEQLTQLFFSLSKASRNNIIKTLFVLSNSLEMLSNLAKAFQSESEEIREIFKQVIENYNFEKLQDIGKQLQNLKDVDPKLAELMAKEIGIKLVKRSSYNDKFSLATFIKEMNISNENDVLELISFMEKQHFKDNEALELVKLLRNLKNIDQKACDNIIKSIGIKLVHLDGSISQIIKELSNKEDISELASLLAQHNPGRFIEEAMEFGLSEAQRTEMIIPGLGKYMLETRQRYPSHKSGSYEAVIRLLQITDPKNILPIVKEFFRYFPDVVINPANLKKFLTSQGISDPDMLYAAFHQYVMFQRSYFNYDYAYFAQFGATDPTKILELVKAIARSFPKQFAKNITNFPTLQSHYFEIWRILAQSDQEAAVGALEQLGFSLLDPQIIQVLIEGNPRWFITQRGALYNALVGKPSHKDWLLHAYHEGIKQKCWEPSLRGLKAFIEESNGKEMWPRLDGMKEELKDIESESPDKLRKKFNDLFEWGKKQGLDLEIVQQIVAPTFNKLNNPQQIIEHLKWLREFLTRCYFDPSLLRSIKENKQVQNVIGDIFALTDASLRESLTHTFLRIFCDPQKRAAWAEIKGCPSHLNTIALLLVPLELGPDLSKQILGSLKGYKDRVTLQTISRLLEQLASMGEAPDRNRIFLSREAEEENKNHYLPGKDKQNLLAFLLAAPPKEERESAPHYQQRLEAFRSKQRDGYSALMYILMRKKGKLLVDVKDIDQLLKIGRSFACENMDLIPSQVKPFVETFIQSSRWPGAVAIYRGSLQKVEDEQDRDRSIKLLQKFTISVLEKQFPQMRYEFENNPHLKAVFENRNELFQKWKASLTTFDLENVFKKNKDKEFLQHSGWTVQDTDHWEDLLLLGTETLSCQHINYGDTRNRCLLAYMCDGKNRAIVLKNREGKIIARSVLQILIDRETREPMLYAENLYSNTPTEAVNAPLASTLVLAGCIEKARQMGLRLFLKTCWSDCGSYFDKYFKECKGDLESLGGPAPWEYVDYHQGTYKDGKFTIDSRCRRELPYQKF